MELIKKIWKEISVFGLVLVVFIGLYAYRQVTHVELSTITQDKLEEKIKDKDSFVVVLGSDSDTTTSSYKEICLDYMEKKEICLDYMEKNRGDTIYYVDLTDESDPTAYIQETFDTDDGTVPSTIVVEKGKLKKQKTGALTYYRIAELFK